MSSVNKGFRIGKSIILNMIQSAIRWWEDKYIGVSASEALQPVFIIGAPRTGSTILYQALTNAYQFIYIDNTACFWHRNLRWGLWLSHKRHGSQPHSNFDATNGNTRKFGGHAPSECGEFWYRWLPKDRHFVDHCEVTPKVVEEMRAEILGASGYFNRPILFKNLNAGQRLRLIHKAFPNAKFIFVRRDPRFVTLSILKARKKVGASAGQWWSIMPANVDELRTLPEGNMCAAQVYFLERQIEKDLALFPKENVQEVHYQDFNENLVRGLGSWCGVSKRDRGEIPAFRQDDVKALAPEELAELNQLVAKYPFKKVLSV
ncbi:MAG: sulfotransferase family protein [Marinobacter adhaerens]